MRRPSVRLVEEKESPCRRTIGEATSAAVDFANLADAGRMDVPAARFFSCFRSNVRRRNQVKGDAERAAMR